PGLETKAPAQEAWPALRSTDCERRRPAGAGTASRSLDGGVVGGRVVGRLVVGARLGGVARGRELAALGALGGRLHAVLAGGLGGLDRRQAGHGGQGGGVGAAVQALHVAGQRADLLVGQLARHLGHDLEHGAVVFRRGAGAVLLEAARGVPGLLPAHVRVGRARVAGAGGAVAGHAGRDAALEIAAAEQLLADLVELHALVRAPGHHGVVGDAGRRGLVGEVGADVAHVLRGEHGRERLHDRVLALAALEQRQLAGHVLLALAADVRVHLRHHALAVHAVAGGAGGGQGGAVLGVAGHGPGQVGHRVHRLQRQGLDRLGLLQRGDRGLGEGDRADREGGDSGEDVAAGVAHRAGLRGTGHRPVGRSQGPSLSGRRREAVKPGQRRRPACDPVRMANPLARAQYLLSAHVPRQLPEDGGFEVAFAGRSNAGKSSALNALCQQNALARVSKTPGRTQQLVFFELPQHERRYLVDLPGYGYAKVPQDLREHWQAFIDHYFRTRLALRGLVVVMDIRHPLKDYDLHMLGYAVERGLPAHALLTKADKLSRGAAGNVVQAVRRDLGKRWGDTVGVQAFSGESKLGVDQARETICAWLEIAPD